MIKKIGPAFFRTQKFPDPFPDQKRCWTFFRPTFFELFLCTNIFGSAFFPEQKNVRTQNHVRTNELFGPTNCLDPKSFSDPKQFETKKNPGKKNRDRKIMIKKLPAIFHSGSLVWINILLDQQKFWTKKSGQEIFRTCIFSDQLRRQKERVW